MVDARTGKPFGRTFFKKYTCETPAFAYNDQSLDKRLRENLESYTASTATDSLWPTISARRRHRW